MSIHSIQITSITCYGTSESNITDGDEVYLSCQADGKVPIRYPAGINPAHNMKAGDPPWLIDNLILNFEYEVLVTLWDHDLNDDPNLATFLQSKDFPPGEGSGAATLTNRNGANYQIAWKYID